MTLYSYELYVQIRSGMDLKVKYNNYSRDVIFYKLFWLIIIHFILVRKTFENNTLRNYASYAVYLLTLYCTII